VASFDKVIPPGGEGKITLKIKTGGYQGRISKGARVYTNDPKKAFFLLRLAADVKVPIYIYPRFVNFIGRPGQSLTRYVLIEAREEKPLKITPVGFNLQDKVNFTIQEMVPGKKFQIVLATAPQVVGAYNGFLKLKTNYPETPEISIKIRVKIRPIKAPLPRPAPPVVPPKAKDSNNI